MSVAPVRPVAPYLGGKHRLARHLVERINSVEHTSYVEAFLGMGGVFLRRNRRPKCEVVNDLNGEVANLFRVLQRHYTAFMEMMRFQVTTRVAFDRLKDTEPRLLTDLERAARFLYLQRLAFGGKVSGHNFGVSTARPARFDITQLAPMLEDVHLRMASVVIECLPWQELIARYDRSETLFYLDPPYYGGEDDYGPGLFESADYGRMAEQLANLQGKFILSINDVPPMRQLFRRFAIEMVETTYSVAKGRTNRARELIISNTSS